MKIRTLAVAICSAVLGALSAGGAAIALSSKPDVARCAPPTWTHDALVFQCIDQQQGPEIVHVRPPHGQDGWAIWTERWDTLGH